MFKTASVEPFMIVGISVETSNVNGEAGRDIGALWSRFYSDNVARQIPDLAGGEIYAVYTDYESDHRGRYTCIVGMRVNSLGEVPEGLTGRRFEGGAFLSITARGLMPGAIFDTWKKIWDEDELLARSYDYDFEIYGDKAMWGDEAEVDIFISVRS